MRIWILSDLHLDVAWMPPPPIQDADVCVVAGDLGEGAVNSVHWLAEHIRPHMRVVFVLGNHKFYHDSIERQRVVADRAAVRSGIDVLDDMSVTIGDMRFVGATIWTDYDLYSGGDAGAPIDLYEEGCAGAERPPADPATRWHLQAVLAEARSRDAPAVASLDRKRAREAV